jgi:cytochrome c556
MCDEFATDMVSLHNTATQLTDEWEKSEVAWGTSKDDVKRSVEKFKAKILKRINEVEDLRRNQNGHIIEHTRDVCFERLYQANYLTI